MSEPRRAQDGEGSLRLANLIAICAAIQEEIHALVKMRVLPEGAKPEEDGPWFGVHQRIQETAAEVAVLCERAGLSPASLAEPSRHAYQWLSFLAEWGNLQAHVRTLGTAMAVDPRPRVDLYHISGLYRGWRRGDQIRLTISEAFVGAPNRVINAVVRIVLPYAHKKAHRRMINEYAESDRFKDVALRLETSGGASADRAKGHVVDLEAVFDRVNQDYFGGEIPRPTLAWNRVASRREYGHYKPSSDLLCISPTLDSPQVPSFVIEYVMFHELLHKKLGVEVVNGRRKVHRPEFRQEEQKFGRYREANEFLDGLSRRRPGK